MTLKNPKPKLIIPPHMRPKKETVQNMPAQFMKEVMMDRAKITAQLLSSIPGWHETSNEKMFDLIERCTADADAICKISIQWDVLQDARKGTGEQDINPVV